MNAVRALVKLWYDFKILVFLFPFNKRFNGGINSTIIKWKQAHMDLYSTNITLNPSCVRRRLSGEIQTKDAFD